MKKILLGIFLISFFQVAWSQQAFFIYFQSNGGAPFYLKMNDRVFSSGANGYFILPNLTDGNYQFSLGLSNSSIAEEKFALTLNTKDHGYVITPADNGLVLTDLQTNSILKPQKASQVAGYSYTRRTDAFTMLLAKALADTSLVYQAVFVEAQAALPATTEERSVPTLEKTTISPIADSTNNKPIAMNNTAPLTQKVVETPDTSSGVTNRSDTIASLIQREPGILIRAAAVDSGGVVQSNEIDTAIMSVTAVVKKNTPAQITRYSENATSEGFGIVFIDEATTGRDTIRLLIPNPTFFIQTNETTASRRDTSFMKQRPDSDVKDPVIRVSADKPVRRNVCTNQATASDLAKLRKNMAAKNTDEKMTEEAKKMFRFKCFTTDEIKSLSSLFASDSGKYRFFDEAYIHVSDSEMFSSLISELSEDYYVKRFRALVGDY